MTMSKERQGKGQETTSNGLPLHYPLTKPSDRARPKQGQWQAKNAPKKKFYGIPRSGGASCSDFLHDDLSGFNDQLVLILIIPPPPQTPDQTWRNARWGQWVHGRTIEVNGRLWQVNS
jgi:hypothetical protein